MACQLPLATILEITAMQWCGKRMEIVTSENASPFMDLVSEGTPCVYTEGYPNSAVKMFLRMLSRFKPKCTHVGDADLDGFLIAEQIRDCIHLDDVKAYKALYWARRLKLDVGIPLTDEQRRRIAAYVAKEGADFRVRDYAEQVVVKGELDLPQEYELVLQLAVQGLDIPRPLDSVRALVEQCRVTWE